MRQLETVFEEIPFEDVEGMPEIKVTFSGCRLGSDRLGFDIVNFLEKKISRWTTLHFKALRGMETIRTQMIARESSANKKKFDYLWAEASKMHAVHASPQGNLVVCTGNLHCGFCVLVIDTKLNRTLIFPEDFDSDIKLYSTTGGFTPDKEHWFFVRWPLDDALDILEGKMDMAKCEVGRFNLDTFEAEIIYEMDNADNIHQITCSGDGRYLVIAPLKYDPKIPYPLVSLQEDPLGYRRSHEAGLHKSELTTIDLKNNRHWRTEISVPVPAHFEFDPISPHIFYVSSHNFSLSLRDEIILEGPGAIIKMEIRDGETVAVGQYSDEEFFRVTQHMPFCFEGRTLIAVTNFPDRLDIIDGQTMTLWHRHQMFPAEPLELNEIGNLVLSELPESCFSINPSTDGKYIVLESVAGMLIFDVANRKFLKQTVSRQIPTGFRGTGHARPYGH